MYFTWKKFKKRKKNTKIPHNKQTHNPIAIKIQIGRQTDGQTDTCICMSAYKDMYVCSVAQVAPILYIKDSDSP